MPGCEKILGLPGDGDAPLVCNSIALLMSNSHLPFTHKRVPYLKPRIEAGLDAPPRKAALP
jgi:hypothetical protein